MTAAVEERSLTSPREVMSESSSGEQRQCGWERAGREKRRTFAALKRRRKKLENSAHLLDLLNNAAPDEDGANLNGGSEDFGVRVGGEGGSESGGDGSLKLLEKKGFFEVDVLRGAEVL